MKKFLIIITTFVLIFVPANVSAKSKISPAIYQIALQPGDSQKFKLTYENDGEEEIHISSLIEAYDNTNEEFLTDGEVFISADQTDTEVKPSNKIHISVELDIPENAVPGTYFNVFAVVEDSNNSSLSGNGVGIEFGSGTLFVIHVLDNEDVKGISSSDLGLDLELVNIGWWPFVPARVEVKFTNLSKYQIKPSGIIKAIAGNGIVVAADDEMNLEELPLPVGESLTKTITYNVPLLSDTRVASMVVENVTGSSIESAITVENYSVYLWGFIGIVGISIGIFIRLRLRKKKQK